MRITLFLFIVGIASLVQAQCSTKQSEFCENPQVLKLDVTTALKSLNDARRKAACVKKASDIKDIKWNPQLAAQAETLANNCESQADNCVTKVVPTAGPLLLTQGFYERLSTASLFEKAIEVWSRQEDTTNQLIYSKATSIGCGVATTEFEKPFTIGTVMHMHYLQCYLDFKHVAGQPAFSAGIPKFKCPATRK